MAVLPSMNLRIRPANAADVPAMHQLRCRVRENRLSGATTITEDSYLPYIAAGTIWLAETESGIAGFAAIDVSVGKVWPIGKVWALFVDPESEGLGIGRALHAALVEWARQHGIDRLVLCTESGSRAAHFYSKAGWSVVGVQPDGELLLEKVTGILVSPPSRPARPSSPGGN